MAKPIPLHRRLLKNERAGEIAERRTTRLVELWAMDEHRVGLKPIRRRMWARRGQRPEVVVRPRYAWLYVSCFVCRETGASAFWLAPSVNTETFRRLLEAFLRNRTEAVMLVLDQGGWHLANEITTIEQKAELELKYLPSPSPELEPAERLWELVDEPLANEVFDSLAELEATLAERCVALTEQADRIRSRTLYHGWPGGADHTATD